MPSAGAAAACGDVGPCGTVRLFPAVLRGFWVRVNIWPRLLMGLPQQHISCWKLAVFAANSVVCKLINVQPVLEDLGFKLLAEPKTS